MSRFANTPESILPRSDSRNPASTCRGININGRPCRRTLAASTPPATAPGGVIAALTGRKTLDPAVFYCWQHKNQVSDSIAASAKIKQAEAVVLSKTNSIDSLIQRLGILEIDDQQNKQSGARPSPQKRREQSDRQSRNHEKESQAKKSSFCCFTVEEGTDSLPAARRVATSNHESSYRKATGPRPPLTPQRPVFIRDPRSSEKPIVQHRSAPVTPDRWPNTLQQTPLRHPAVSHQISVRQQHLETHTRPSLLSASTPHLPKTPPLLSLIPQHLSPQTTALLMTELAKPISAADEDGYIYIFWVTPQASNTMKSPPRDVAANLLPPPGRPSNSRRTSDALRAAQSIDPGSKGSAGHPGTIRLKIGRTSNVHRRLNEWSKQCSHDLALIRYYPHTTLSPQHSPSPSPARRSGDEAFQVHGRRVPHVHRVERLIHIELADQRVRGEGPCSQCGKEHREWFEFIATKEVLRRVDETIRRWVEWGEHHA